MSEFTKADDKECDDGFPEHIVLNNDGQVVGTVDDVEAEIGTGVCSDDIWVNFPEVQHQLGMLMKENAALKDALEDRRSYTLNEWSYCPECGSDEAGHNPGLEASHRFCKSCGQEWFTDMDYTKVIRSHLSKRNPREVSNG